MLNRLICRLLSYVAICRNRLSFSIALFLLPTLAFAQSESPVGEGLSYIINTFIDGQDGIILATIAIACVGVLCFAHHLEWKRLFQTIGGIAIVFGASSIAEGLKALVH
jgi:type IV secretory pathway VirB2 component (pilin)